MYFHRIQNPQWFALGAMLLVLGSPVEAQQWQEARTAATTLGIQLVSLEVRTAGELDKSSESATGGRVDAFLVLRNPLFYVLRTRIVTLAEKSRLPGMYPSREFVDARGLMRYGANNDA
jgi:putative ABC transport system substrate-binding protein